MIDEAINAYIQERKQDWLKKKIKPSMNEDERDAWYQKASEKFDLGNWLIDAAHRAQSMSISTHPCTFSHPSSRKNKNGYVTPIIAKSRRADDGLLRSGNVFVENDALGNAAALDVYKFLMIDLYDGKKLIQHLIEETDQAKALFEAVGTQYQEVRDGLLGMLQRNSDQEVTSSKIKQVYFPVDDMQKTYHLLSVLTPSGIVFALRERIDEMRFGERTKLLREARKNGECSDQGFMTLVHLTITKYGGTKPQNISVLNNKFGGRAYLLNSMPPKLKKRNIRFPKKDFFSETLHSKSLVEDFDAIVALMQTDYNNVHIREGIQQRFRMIVEKIIEYMWAVRTIASENYFEKSSKLSAWQKAWLLPTLRDEDDEIWIDEVHRQIVHWIVMQIEKRIEKQSGKKLLLGPDERETLKNIVSEYREMFL